MRLCFLFVCITILPYLRAHFPFGTSDNNSLIVYKSNLSIADQNTVVRALHVRGYLLSESAQSACNQKNKAHSTKITHSCLCSHGPYQQRGPPCDPPWPPPCGQQPSKDETLVSDTDRFFKRKRTRKFEVILHCLQFSWLQKKGI